MEKIVLEVFDHVVDVRTETLGVITGRQWCENRPRIYLYRVNFQGSDGPDLWVAPCRLKYAEAPETR